MRFYTIAALFMASLAIAAPIAAPAAEPVVDPDAVDCHEDYD
jgi:hypothetical protein